MLLKWIVCDITATSKNDFSLAQKMWSALSELPGFIGQLGGWNLKSQEQACILSLWQDYKHYQAFMDNGHDAIFRDNQQESTYDCISVLLLDSLYDMNGTHACMTDCLTEAHVIRVAVCQVRPEREEHFLQVERDIWLPAMATSNGMLAGAFSRAVKANQRYAVTTLWTNAQAHEKYVRDKLPQLQEKASVFEDVEQLTAYTVPLNDQWLVLPED